MACSEPASSMAWGPPVISGQKLCKSLFRRIKPIKRFKRFFKRRPIEPVDANRCCIRYFARQNQAQTLDTSRRDHWRLGENSASNGSRRGLSFLNEYLLSSHLHINHHGLLINQSPWRQLHWRSSINHHWRAHQSITMAAIVMLVNY